MSVLAALALGAGGAVAAAVAVRAYATCPRTRSLWWLAGLAAGLAGLLGTVSPVPVAVALGGAGLAAAAVIDAVERRIPPSLAHGTTATSGAALAVECWSAARWSLAGTAVVFTAGVVALFAVLWLVGGMGYGDVRLAASTVTASVAGLSGALTLLWGAFAAAGVTAVVSRRWRRLPGGDRRLIPFAPAVAAGWLLAVAIT